MKTNKIALVTGGSRGLGREMALRIAKKGIDIVLTYHSKKEEAEQVVAEIERMGQKAIAFQLDTAKVATFDALLEKVTTYLIKENGDPYFDFLINNAGIGVRKPFLETTEADFDLMMNIHLKGVYFLTQKAVPFLNEGGRVINISSGLARYSGPGFSAYASMKGGVETLTRYMAKELGAKGIAANAVAPGPTETDFDGGGVRDNKEINKRVAANTALGRTGLPEDIGGVVAFLCTDDACWVNAQRIEVSGGQNI